MAKIVHSDDAPTEAVHYSLAGVEFDLGGKSDAAAYETDDAEVISNAAVHPWLAVEFDPVDVAAETAATDDDANLNRTALDAGLDQNESVSIEAGNVVIAETLAADDDHDAAKSARNFKGSN
jgi:hypothetical protein